MKRLAFTLSLLVCALQFALAQTARPRLVVGIVVDQMRWDYLDRYRSQFTDGGFNRLVDEGYSCNNCLINYVPTVTAIGHTSAYTGTSPAYHGICGNTFYIDGRRVVSCQDDSEKAVGSNLANGNRSPRNLLATTIGDQLRLHTDFRSKVVGVSYKDRAAIFPAGHSANAAYWLDTKNLCFITSTYYMQQLPDYVKEVNAALKKNKEVQQAGSRIGYTALCGTITTDMAIAALQGERLGQGEATDMLCISYSETDVIGHEWGTRGDHTDEAYLVLDRDIDRLLKALDRQVGRGNYLLFLTADHGASHNWRFLQEHHLPGGPLMIQNTVKAIEDHVARKLGATKSVVNDMLDYRVFLNHQSIAEQGLSLQQVKEAVVECLKAMPEVVTAVDFEQARLSALPPLQLERVLMGYYPGRSGDVIAILKPHYYAWWDDNSPTHTTHGSWNPYDAHIPLLFFGWQVEHGATSREVHITDIAPTVCQMLRIQQPSACSGEPITEVAR
ncbi:MAG: alkaline phosphatase family protein [Prevotella sp.]|nr:alkaline phosphatase family protein [Prevotella sp.]